MLEPKTGPELIDVKAAGSVYSGGGKKKKAVPQLFLQDRHKENSGSFCGFQGNRKYICANSGS